MSEHQLPELRSGHQMVWFDGVRPAYHTVASKVKIPTRFLSQISLIYQLLFTKPLLCPTLLA